MGRPDMRLESSALDAGRSPAVRKMRIKGNGMKIAVAGTGYVGLSLAVLLSQHNEVHALDIVPEKVEKINAFMSPIQDDRSSASSPRRRRGSGSSICVLPSTRRRPIPALTTL